MQYLKRITLLFFLQVVLLYPPVYSQNKQLEALKEQLEQASSDAERSRILVRMSKVSLDRTEALEFAKKSAESAKTPIEKGSAYNQVAWSYKNLFQYDSARFYADQAMSFADESGDPLSISDVFSTLGSIFNNQSNYDSAIYYHKLALSKRRETDDLAAQAASMNNLSLVYQRLAQYAEAVSYIDQSISIYENLGGGRQAADSYLNKGNLLLNKGSLDEAYLSFQNALKVYEELGLNTMMTYALINMGTTSAQLNNYDNAFKEYKRSYDILQGGDRNPMLLSYAYNGMGAMYDEYFLKFDSAIYYYKNGAENAEVANNGYLLSISHNNLGTLYRKINDFDSAMFFHESAIQLKTDIQDLSGLSSALINRGNTYLELKKYALAEKDFLESLSIAEDINEMGDRERAYGVLYEYSKLRNRFKDALQYLERRDVVKDSIITTEHLNKVADLNLQYETDKKEKQIELQEVQLSAQESKLQRNQVLILALVAIAILLVAVVLLVRNQARKKEALIAREGELKLREAEINAVINSQEKERNRFARDLHDGFGQLISVLKLNLSQLNEVTNRDMEKREEVFKNGESVINEMFAELRNICFDLMPQTLVKRGLTSALKELGDRINQTQKVNCEILVFNNNERLSNIMEISLFRITQEWVNNILKYAGATNITIQLTREESELTLTIEDNGTGFDTKEFYEGKGNGWKNIQTRLNQIGGQFDLDSRSGIKSTMLTVNVEVDTVPTTTESEMVEAQD